MGHSPCGHGQHQAERPSDAAPHGPPFNESIAGIHLGMTLAEVTATLGAPTQAGNLNCYVSTYGWYYAPLRIAVTFDADTVTASFC